MGKTVNIINRILFYGLLITGVVILFLGRGPQNTMLFAFGSFIASWGFRYLLKTKNVSENYWIFINIGLWLNLLGEAVLYYTGFTFYDKILHFSMGLLITIILYEYFSKNLKVKKDIIFFTLLGILCIWEIWEYILFTYFGYPCMGVINNGIVSQTPLDDTFFDLIFGAIGSLTYLIFKKENVSEGVKSGIRKFRR